MGSRPPESPPAAPVTPEIHAPEDDLRARLEDIFADRLRLRVQDAAPRVPIAPDSTLFPSPETCARFPTAVRILGFCNGHQGSALRALLIDPTARHETISYVRALFLWSQHAVTTSPVTLEQFPDIPIPELLETARDARDCYERLQFAAQHPEVTAATYPAALARACAQAIDLPPDARWIDMVDALFGTSDRETLLRRMLTNVGFLPTELLTKKRFRTIGAAPITESIAALRALEEEPALLHARTERAHLTAYFLRNGDATGLRTRRGHTPLTIDASGIRIDGEYLHTHLPYGLLSAELLATLQHNQWLPTDAAYHEARVRMHEQQNNRAAYVHVAAAQFDAFAAAWSLQEHQPPTLTQLTTEALRNPDAFSARCVRTNAIIPDLLFHALLQQGPSGAFAVLRIGDAVGAALAGERVRREAYRFSSHDLLHEQNTEYRSRVRLLYDPNYYNAAKAARAFLSAPPPEPTMTFVAFRGRYTTSEQHGQHGFVEAIADGQLARILVNEDRHLDAGHRRTLETLPLFAQDQYEHLEDALRTFRYFTHTVTTLEQIDTQRRGRWQERFHSYAETALHFLLTNATSYHASARRAFDALTTGSADAWSTTATAALLTLLRTAQQHYARFLYGNITTAMDFEQRFLPEVRPHEVIFGPSFLEAAAQHCNAAWGYAAALAQKPATIRTVALTHRTEDPSGTIPFHMEESILERLRLDRTRPLINIMGGCRAVGDMSHSTTNPLSQFADAVLTVAHAHRANVSVPGTQSGMGVTFGHANVEYQRTCGHLPKRERAHLFAISPGMSTYVPGNESWTNAAKNQDEVFAITPVDAILTPFEANWEYRGRDRWNASYVHHIRYMEALYARLSVDQPRVMVIGNGGFWTVAEAIASLEHGFDCMLVRNTGRFAECIAPIVESLDQVPLEDDPNTCTRYLLDCMSAAVTPDVLAEFQKKDFGCSIPGETADYEEYRRLVRLFLRTLRDRRARVRITTTATLAQELDEYLTKQHPIATPI